MKVLGVDYELIHDEDLIKNGLDGECQSYSKKNQNQTKGTDAW